jgi:hypothetical protein
VGPSDYVPGSPTANGPISAWRAPPSAACRSTWS